MVRVVVSLVFMMGVVVCGGAANAASGDRLREIRSQGYLTCGLRMGQPGFAATDESGRVNGFMVDFCRALAAATLGDAAAVKPRNLPDKPQEMSAVENGDVDVSFSATTWTLGREASLNVTFVQPIFYDGQGFAIWGNAKPASLQALGPQTVCVKSPTTTVRTLKDIIEQNRQSWSVRSFKTLDQALQAFLARECTMFTTDRSVLLTVLAPWRNDANLHVLPDVVSREPLTPYVAASDPQWVEIVRWTIFATILAEQKGITSANVAANVPGGDDETDRLLGRAGTLGQILGLQRDWAFKVISQVGNYGEIFERNLGQGSRFGLERGLNDLAGRGGLLYSPPFQ